LLALGIGRFYVLVAALAVVLACAAGLHEPADAAAEQVGVTLNPTVTGPIPADPVGSADRNYPLAAASQNLKAHHYEEQEFFFAGPAGVYKSRMVVRRPANPKHFSGVVWVEWLNVTRGYDLDLLWSRAAEHIMKRGDAYVAVDSQATGVEGPAGLKAWSPQRYRSLSIPPSGYFVAEAGAYEIYAQALQAIRHPNGVKPLGELGVQTLIAHGYSQSAGTVSIWSNSGMATLHGLADGFLIGGLSTSTTGGTGEASVEYPFIQSGTGVPIMLLNTETDYSFHKLWPDNDDFRLWEVAGATHIDQDSEDYLKGTYLRDFGQPEPGFECERPPIGAIPYKYVQNDAMDALVRWIRFGTPPPSQPGIVTDESGNIVRDAYGNALGGVRLPEQEVPTATNSRENAGEANCSLAGSHIAFTPEQLQQLYPTHRAYVAKVKESAEADVGQGVLLPEDAKTIIRTAKKEPIP